jgi:hypothetical protein
MGDQISDSWSNLNEAVELGSLQGSGDAIQGAFGLTQDEQPGIAAPVCRPGVHNPSMVPENASTGFMPIVRRVSSIAEISTGIVLDNSRFAPITAQALPTVDRRLLHAHRLGTWQARRPEIVVNRSDLHPSAEPTGIWNRVPLGLLDCRLVEPETHPVEPEFQADGLNVVESALMPSDGLEPAFAQLNQLCAAGLPAPNESPLEIIQNACAMSLQDTRPIGPQLNITLPSPAPLRR